MSATVSQVNLVRGRILWQYRGMMRTDGHIEGLSWESPRDVNGKLGRGRRSAVPQIVEQLKHRPGEWARVTVVSHKSTSRLQRRFPGTEWVARDVGSDDPKLFGRWVGLDGEYA